MDFEKSDMIYINILLLNICIMCIYFPLDWPCKIFCVLHLHVLRVLHVRSCAIISLLANCYVDSTMMAKVNSCIHFNFCINDIILFLSEN